MTTLPARPTRGHADSCAGAELGRPAETPALSRPPPATGRVCPCYFCLLFLERTSYTILENTTKNHQPHHIATHAQTSDWPRIIYQKVYHWLFFYYLFYTSNSLSVKKYVLLNVTRYFNKIRQWDVSLGSITWCPVTACLVWYCFQRVHHSCVAAPSGTETHCLGAIRAGQRVFITCRKESADNKEIYGGK